MTIAELRRMLDAIEEQEGVGPHTPICLDDTGSCFLEDPVLAVESVGADPLILIQTVTKRDMADRYCVGEHIPKPRLRLA